MRSFTAPPPVRSERWGLQRADGKKSSMRCMASRLTRAGAVSGLARGGRAPPGQIRAGLAQDLVGLAKLA